ncbi:hypothetical protein M9H77_01772 [Catharanthus roseus]|uniref:Uncharacterized protein n=1 Tax=Catharanthus roseus TaxID=4058 RepID=A0ACC0C6M8_CATRO|nr:hypothetical protein M9H77_01772 [Catharanthus roseus]
MKGSSKVIMGTTLIMVVSLALILGLVFVLLVQLYCSLLLHRRRRRTTTTTTTSCPPSRLHHHEHSTTTTPSLSGFYSQGVLHAPRSFLFPSEELDLEKQTQNHSQFLESQTQKPSSSSSRLQAASASPPDSNYIYICNPIYDDDVEDGGNNRVETPFQTPDSSPSRLEGAEGNSSSDDDDEVISSSSSSSPSSTPLTPMKKLPAEGCSVSLRDAGSLATSGSEDSNSNNYGISSSSSSGSPCTSPSW